MKFATLGAAIALTPVAAYADTPLQSVELDEDTRATQQWRGKPVILRVGKGFSEDQANLVAAFLNRDGCPTTVTNEGGDKWLPRLTVEVGDYSGKFKSIGSAGSMAKDLCLGQGPDKE